ncbi:Small nuclear ribonucleoprotein family protein isoform 1 [Hibiscus syriacus]|uniref:Small nuclear ribonucleoprotein family protein isoform 1 n=1 Tax=Hibiscus syriacus TaxID=106335 RepID=A0A6A3A7M0_HIBSY|nr:Small nuclear ribonucleoprotein family protein isoform 1 [Hibiscus syriacus]
MISPSGGCFYPELHYFRSVMAAVRLLHLLTLLFITLSFPTLCSSQSDADILIKFKESFTQGNLSGWIPGPAVSPCQKKWVGVMCRGVYYWSPIGGFKPFGNCRRPAFASTSLLEIHQLNEELVHRTHPKSLAKFGADSFQGNVRLCGKPTANDCIKEAPPAPPPVASSPSPSGKIQNQNQNRTEADRAKSIYHGNVMLVATTMFFVLCIVVASLFSANCKTKKEDGVRGQSKQTVRAEVLPVRLPPESIHRRPVDSSPRSKPGSRRDPKAPATKGGTVDMVIVNGERGEFGLHDLMKATAEVLGNGALGSAYKATMVNGLAVVVKRMRWLNRLRKDEFDAKMRRFGALKHNNVLTPLAYNCRKEEKLIVSEYVPKGSLSYVLHGKLPSQYLSNNEGGIDIVQWVQTSISEDRALELIDPEIANDESSTDSILQSSSSELLASKAQFQGKRHGFCIGDCSKVESCSTPEGGFFAESFRDNSVLLSKSHLPPQYKVDRPVSTSIYFLLPSGNVSHLHRIPCAETWHFYLGEPLTVLELDEKDGQVKLTCLGPDLLNDQKVQYTVPPNVWFGAFPTKDFHISTDGVVTKNEPSDAESHYSLVGCTCAPAFQFQDFELAKRSELVPRFPKHENLLSLLTYPN